MAKILKAGLEKCSMGVIPPTADCLLIGDIERSRLPEIKYLFVLGEMCIRDRCNTDDNANQQTYDSTNHTYRINEKHLPLIQFSKCNF